jgi:N-succinyldiaminopimelate aminotransferase
MNALAEQYQAVNLGSGTPDTPLPEAIKRAAQEAIDADHNQYGPVRGVEPLRQGIAAHAARFYGQQVDPATEVTVTCGVTEALQAAMLAFVEPGDEVMVFEPFYDCYVPAIQMAGGKAVPVTLHAPRFRFDAVELRAAFSPRTKAIVINTPHNPTGIAYSMEELRLIAELCQEHDVLAISDEVYEHVIFDDTPHIRLTTLPGMWERTLTLSGAGKTFSCTGWRLGWAIGPGPMHDALARLRQFTVFAAPTPVQYGIAAGLRFPDSYFRELGAEYQQRRDFLLPVLERCGLAPVKPQGSFFILTDVSKTQAGDGSAFCQDLARNVGVVPVPTDTFYLHRHLGSRIARFSFCQSRAMLQTAAERLPKLQVGA